MRLIPNLPTGSRRPRLGRPPSVVALEISADAIVAFERATGDAGRERQAIARPLPVGIVTDGEVTNADALAAELTSLFSEHKLPRDVRVALAHPRLIVRMVDVPAGLQGTELDSAVRHLSEDLLPMALDDVVLDYRRAGVTSALDGHERILVAAVRRDGVDRLTAALQLAGLRALQVQVSGLALLHALQEPAVEDEAVVYVQAGALTNVVIAEDGEPILVRAASAGSEAIAAGLAERAEIDHESARRHAAAIGLGGSDDPAVEQLAPVVDAQVREGLRRVVAEIQSSLEFYASRPEARSVGAAVLTGPMTAWPGVAEALERDLGLPVLPAGRRGWPRLAGGVEPERLDVVVGLALAPADERPDLRAAHRRRAGREPSSGTDRVPQIACAMVALLAAAVVYLVVVSNDVTSSKERLNQIGTELVGAERKASELKPYADFAAATATRREAVSAVAASRFNWERGLRQLAQVTPRDVWLTSVKGTLTPGTAVEGGTGEGGTSALRSVRTTPAFELTGCAVREQRVPAFMERLRRMSKATEVGFSRSERLDADKSSSGGGEDCRNGDDEAPRFDLVTFFEPVTSPLPVPGSAAAGGSPDAGAGAPPSQAAPATAPDTTTAKVTP